MGQFAAEYVAIGKGFGRTIEDIEINPDLLALNKANYAGLVLWILSLYASKCAAIVFMSRFAQPGRHKKEILAMLVIVAVLGFGSLLALTIDCSIVDSIYYWDFPAHRNHCPQPVSSFNSSQHMEDQD
ncbi:MAG: hypothetical protein Q9207_002817 [Kuettlingeria erythrocarpa]